MFLVTQPPPPPHHHQKIKFTNAPFASESKYVVSYGTCRQNGIIKRGTQRSNSVEKARSKPPHCFVWCTMLNLAPSLSCEHNGKPYCCNPCWKPRFGPCEHWVFGHASSRSIEGHALHHAPHHEHYPGAIGLQWCISVDPKNAFDSNTSDGAQSGFYAIPGRDIRSSIADHHSDTMYLTKSPLNLQAYSGLLPQASQRVSWFEGVHYVQWCIASNAGSDWSTLIGIFSVAMDGQR